jgi:hypothetical protein
MSNEELVKEIITLKEEIQQLKTQLEKYVNPRKTYYENNKEYIKAQAKEGLKKIAQENPDKLKEYRRRAYLKRKEKLNENIKENK